MLISGINFTPEPTGIAVYTTGLAKGLADRGFEVRVITGLPHYPQWRVQSNFQGNKMHVDRSVEGVIVHRVNHYVPSNPSLMNRTRMEIEFGVRMIMQDWGQPDAIISVTPALIPTFGAILKSKYSRTKIPTGVWVQDLYSLGVVETGAMSKTPARLVQALEARTLRSADQIAVIHDRFAHQLVSKMNVEQSRITTIRNWTHTNSPVENNRMPGNKEAKALNLHTGRAVVLHAGNMGAKQGLENVINAGKIAQEQNLPIQFVLLGDGNQRRRLQELAKRNDNVTFVDPLDDNEFEDALEDADYLLVNEAVGVAEMAVPSKLTTYFNAGKPVIAATDPYGITADEVRKSGAGVVVQSGEPSALIEAIQGLEKQADYRRKLSMNGPIYSQKYLSSSAMLDKFARWTDALASHVGKSTP